MKMISASVYCMKISVLLFLFNTHAWGQSKDSLLQGFKNPPAEGWPRTWWHVVIDAGKTFQTIHNFGASDAWAAQFVGKWPDSARNNIADLLFSTSYDQHGKPRGIGLSCWRFNFGAGSKEQGQESGIRDEWRRAESFLESNGSYDAKKQEGQQWFLKAAKARGVKLFLGFYNSPPIQFTKNGKSFSSDGKCNIDSGGYGNFSSYVTRSLKLVEKNTGIHFNYISPVNEPQWDWKDGGQEGNPYTNQQIAALVRTLNAQLETEKLDTRIVLPEAGKLDYFLADNDKPDRGNQINDFFCERRQQCRQAFSRGKSNCRS